MYNLIIITKLLKNHSVKSCFKLITRATLKTSQSSWKNICVGVSFLMKLQASGQACNFIKEETTIQVLFREFCEIFKSTFFIEHLWATVSETFTVSIQPLLFLTFSFQNFLFTSVGIVSYKRLCLLKKEVGLVSVSRNSAAITFTSLLLWNLVIGLFKVFSVLIRELAWILANWKVRMEIMKIWFCLVPNCSNKE